MYCTYIVLYKVKSYFRQMIVLLYQYLITFQNAGAELATARVSIFDKKFIGKILQLFLI
jgi:hypothetical protein